MTTPTTDAVQEANPEVDVNDIDLAYSYLKHYGYLSGAVLSESVTPLMAVDSLGNAVKEFQMAAGLPVTGEVTRDTLEKMAQPRCGVLDVQRVGAEEARWRKNRLKYFVQGRVKKIPTSSQDAILKAAWDSWSEVADLQIEQVQTVQEADIVISIGQGRSQGFDGPSGTLAWAYLPTGDDSQLLMRFDVDETWAADSGAQGTLLLNVAAHEFGHLLGLDHS